MLNKTNQAITSVVMKKIEHDWQGMTFKVHGPYLDE